jgi:hypothetical protein
MSDIEGKAARVAAMELGNDRVSIQEMIELHSCFEPRSVPALTRSFSARFAFYVARPFAPFMFS